MNRFIIVAIIALVLLSLGGYLYFNSEKGMGNQQTGGHGSTSGGHGAATQGERSYEIEVLSSTSNLEPNKEIQFKYKIKTGKGETLKSYEIAHEKIMHFIAVRKDLQYFQHLHPEYQESTGEFSVNVAFPTDGIYRLFPDFTPGIDNPEKLPVTVYHDLDVGDISKYKAQPVLPDASTKKTTGEYQITYNYFPTKIMMMDEISYGLAIERNGQPVKDLETYLGALGHSVILKEGTLDFIHTHAEGATTNRDNEIKFSTSFPKAGIYKIFTQFQHQGKVLTTDYVIKVD